MPEYSSTTITPADAVQTPAMNGGTSGNYTLSSLKGYVLAGKGQANGIASLDANGKLPSSQLPEIADDVLVYDSYATLPVTGLEGVIYITADTERMYRWDGAQYAELSVDLSAYATKAYVDEADGVLEAKVSQHEARIANLEQVSGDYVTEDMQDYSSVPTGKASFALVETMKGVSRVENQLVNKTAFPATQTVNGITYTNNGDGSFTLNGESTDAVLIPIVGSGDMIPIPTGHKCLFSGIGGGSDYYFQIKDNLDGNIGSVSSDIIFTMTGTSCRFNFRINEAGKTLSNLKLNPMITDLTIYFNGGTVPSLAEIQSKYPELLEPRAYNAGEIVDSTYTKVESVGVNIFDEVMERGSINWSTNRFEASSTGGRLFATNYVQVLPNTTYFGLNFYSLAPALYGYQTKNGNGTEITINSDNTFTTPSDCHFINFGLTVSTYGDHYKNDITIAKGSTAVTYHPYMTDTLPIPSVTLKGAGSVHDELDVETGVVTRKAGSGTIAISSIYERASNPNCDFAIFALPSAWIASTTIMIPGVERSSYSWDTIPSANYFMVYDTTKNEIAISVSKGTTLTQAKATYDGRVVNYGLSTPTTESVSPTLDNIIKTEGGGTVYTDADVDGQFTMGFLNL